MARKAKQGLDYFPFDVDFHDDDKLAFVGARFGFKGENITIRLLCRIYKDKGYYCTWSDDEALLFAKRIGFENTLVNDVVHELVKRDFFNKILFDSFKILTSKGIQERYFEVKGRSQKPGIIQEYLINVTKKAINVTLIEDNAEIITQSKVKESKVKESKVNKSKVEEINSSQQEIFFRMKNEIVKEKTSDYFYRNHQSFAEQYMMKYDKQMEYLQSALDEMDASYSFYEFNSETHLQNTFKTCYEKVLKEKPVKKESGIKSVIEGHNEARERIIARHQNG